jgi:hypothetical protein
MPVVIGILPYDRSVSVGSASGQSIDAAQHKTQTQTCASRAAEAAPFGTAASMIWDTCSASIAAPELQICCGIEEKEGVAAKFFLRSVNTFVDSARRASQARIHIDIVSSLPAASVPPYHAKLLLLLRRCCWTSLQRRRCRCRWPPLRKHAAPLPFCFD